MSDEKLETPILAKLTLGDWSNDGHGEYDEISYMVNYSISDIRQAYKDSCRLTRVQFNHNENYIGMEKGNIYNQILTDYGQNYIRKPEVAVLRVYDVITDEYVESRQLIEDESGILITKPEDAADIIMRFIALSMPRDFTYKECALKAEPINGWWNDELNVQFGYGIYDIL